MPSIASTAGVTPVIDDSCVLSNDSAYPASGITITGTYNHADYSDFGLYTPSYRTPWRGTINDLLNGHANTATNTVTVGAGYNGSRTDVVIGDIVDWPAPSGPQTITTTNVHFEPSGPGAGFTWDTVTDIRDMDIGTSLMDAYIPISRPVDTYIPISKPVHEPEPEPECVDVDETEWAELLTES